MSSENSSFRSYLQVFSAVLSGVVATIVAIMLWMGQPEELSRGLISKLCNPAGRFSEIVQSFMSEL